MMYLNTIQALILISLSFTISQNAEPNITLTIPDATAAPGESFTIPLIVSKADSIAGVQFVLRFNSEILTAVGADLTDLTTGFTLVDSASAGEIFVIFASATGISGGSGSLVNLRFRVNDTAFQGDTTTLALQEVKVRNAKIGDPEPIPFTARNGLFTVKITEIFASPNPFTPNGDGYNDSVEFKLPEGQFAQPEVQIFSVSGRLVRTLSDFTRNRLRWDGLDADGRALTPGTYIFLIKSGGSTIANGTVTVMR